MITIIPSPLSNAFRNFNGSIEKIEEGVSKDGVQLRNVKTWEEKRFPDSIQKERTIVYSSNLKKWLLNGFSDNNPDLNELVQRCRLTNSRKNHPDFGKLITSCDIYDPNDPFFVNPNLFIKLKEGYGNLNLSTPIDRLLYEGALKNHRFAIGGEEDDPYVQRRAKYIIVDKNIDKKNKEVTRNNTLEATKLYDSLSEDKLKSVGLAIGVIKDKNIDASIVKDVLFEYVLDNKTKLPGSEKTKQEVFLEACKMDVQHLHIRNVVQLGFSSGVIKRDKDLGYTAFGNAVGKSKEFVFNYFLDIKNSEILLRLEQAVNI